MKKIYNSINAPSAVGPYSQAVGDKGLIFISGQIPIDPETEKIIIGDIKEQTIQIMKNIGSILKDAGMDYEHILKTTIYLKDINDFKAMNEAYAGFFADNFPARAAFQVSALPLGAMIEIEAIASPDGTA